MTRSTMPPMATSIGKSITVRGTVHADEPVTIMGTITGDVLASNQDVIVEAGGRVDGAIMGRRITVRGRCNGRLIARELVRVYQSAAVRADVAAPKIALAEGATFTGSVEPGRVDAAIIVQAYRNAKAEHAAAAAAT